MMQQIKGQKAKPHFKIKIHDCLILIFGL